MDAGGRATQDAQAEGPGERVHKPPLPSPLPEGRGDHGNTAQPGKLTQLKASRRASG